MNDLVERDDVLQLVRKSISSMVAYAMGKTDSVIVLDEEAVMKIPSVDAKPVVYAAWQIRGRKDGTRELYCSNCENVPTSKVLADGNTIWYVPEIEAVMKYCPRCGAKMTR